jgi:hypothetical protein
VAVGKRSSKRLAWKRSAKQSCNREKSMRYMQAVADVMRRYLVASFLTGKCKIGEQAPSDPRKMHQGQQSCHELCQPISPVFMGLLVSNDYFQHVRG